MTCERCSGTHRIPWPEAGMMQDCDCVRLGAPVRATPVFDASAPCIDVDGWPLPDGLEWSAFHASAGPAWGRWFIHNPAATQQRLGEFRGVPMGALLHTHLYLFPLLQQRNREESWR